MFLYDLEQADGHALYEKLTGCIRRDILSGRLVAGTRLPSKRQAATMLGVSVVTVMGAYEQLLAEGYILPVQRKGYYVAKLEQRPFAGQDRPVRPPVPPAPESEESRANALP